MKINSNGLSNIKSVFSILKGKKTKFPYYVFVQSLVGLLFVAFVFSFSNIISAIDTWDISQVIFWVVILIGIRILMLFVKYFQGQLNKTVPANITITLRQRFLRSIFLLESKQADDFSNADLITRFSSDLNSVCQLFCNVITNIIGIAVTVFFITMYTNELDWRINLLLVISAPIIFMVSRRAGNRIDLASKKLQISKTELNAVTKDVLDNKEEIVSFDAIPFFLNLIKSKTDHAYHNEIDLYQEERKLWFVEMIVYGSFSIGYFVISALLAFYQGAGVGYVAGMLLLNSVLVEKLFDIPNAYSQYKKILPMLKRYLEVVDNGNSDIKNKNNREVVNSNIAIEFDSVTFSYSEENIISNVSFQIEKGDRVLVVGPSGAGKSTIIKLMLGYSKAYSGNIRFFGTDLSALSSSWMRENMAYIPQSIYLFNTSIKENLYLFSDSTDNDFEMYSNMANISAEIATLPASYDTIIENNNGLSQGQIQRIAWMICFLKKAEIIIIDEGFSSIDPNNIDYLCNHLFNKKGQTIVFVSHVATKKISAFFNKTLHVDHDKITFNTQNGVTTAK